MIEILPIMPMKAGPMKSDVILIKLKECIQHMKDCGLILNLTDEQYFIYSGDRIYFYMILHTL